MRRTQLHPHLIEIQADNQFTLMQDIRRILQASVEYQHCAQCCYDLLNYSVEAERFQIAQSILEAFIFTCETIDRADREICGLDRNQLFYVLPKDEAYLLVKRVLTFTRNRDEPELELMDVTTENMHF
ncbi:MAG: hypothetical protein A3F13_00025 [Gammaproteobacteria bacterium RIFCSPHIGHO2_12_FULL_40_19]|nr:MAG: hypothetical protein A3F13_00025 [Gammaproteobacteria bacterium RIFCSPHIGHO2_12_FULL_40_19]